MILSIVYTSESSEDHAHNEEYTSRYSDQDYLNDDNKQRSGSNDREVELHIPYALPDSLTHTKPKPISHFSMGSTHSLCPMIANILTNQDNTKVLPTSDDPILSTTSHMTSTLSLSSDKSQLSREKLKEQQHKHLLVGVAPLQSNLYKYPH